MSRNSREFPKEALRPFIQPSKRIPNLLFHHVNRPLEQELHTDEEINADEKALLSELRPLLEDESKRSLVQSSLQQQNGYGETILFLALTPYARFTVALTLLDHLPDALLQVGDQDGQTILHILAGLRVPSTPGARQNMKLFLHRLAEKGLLQTLFWQPNQAGYLPIHLAVLKAGQTQQTQFVSDLLAYNVPASGDRPGAPPYRSLLQAGDRYGRTPLHLALGAHFNRQESQTRGGGQRIIEFLLAPQLESKQAYLPSPLHLKERPFPLKKIILLPDRAQLDALTRYKEDCVYGASTTTATQVILRWSVDGETREKTLDLGQWAEMKLPGVPLPGAQPIEVTQALPLELLGERLNLSAWELAHTFYRLNRVRGENVFLALTSAHHRQIKSLTDMGWREPSALTGSPAAVSHDDLWEQTYREVCEVDPLHTAEYTRLYQTYRDLYHPIVHGDEKAAQEALPRWLATRREDHRLAGAGVDKAYEDKNTMPQDLAKWKAQLLCLESAFPPEDLPELPTWRTVTTLTPAEQKQLSDWVGEKWLTDIREKHRETHSARGVAHALQTQYETGTCDWLICQKKGAFYAEVVKRTTDVSRYAHLFAIYGSLANALIHAPFAQEQKSGQARLPQTLIRPTPAPLPVPDLKMIREQIEETVVLAESVISQTPSAPELQKLLASFRAVDQYRLLNSLDWSRFSDQEQVSLLQRVKINLGDWLRTSGVAPAQIATHPWTLPVERLTLRHCRILGYPLDTSRLSPLSYWHILFSPLQGLKQLTLIGMDLRDSMYWKELAASCPQLERLTLQDVQLSAAWSADRWPCLTHLEINSPSLKQFSVTQSPRLSVLDLSGSEQITSVSVRGAPLLSMIGSRGLTHWSHLDCDPEHKSLLPLAALLATFTSREARAAVCSIEIGIPSRLHQAAAIGELAIVRFLVDAGMVLNNTDALGRTAVYVAASKGHLPILEYLSRLPGLDHALHDKGGRTPLHAAEYAGHKAAAQILREAGWDPMAEDEKGHRPDELAALHVRQQALATMPALDSKTARVEPVVVLQTNPPRESTIRLQLEDPAVPDRLPVLMNEEEARRAMAALATQIASVSDRLSALEAGLPGMAPKNLPLPTLTWRTFTQLSHEEYATLTAIFGSDAAVTRLRELSDREYQQEIRLTQAHLAQLKTQHSALSARLGQREDRLSAASPAVRVPYSSRYSPRWWTSTPDAKTVVPGHSPSPSL